MRRKLSLVIAFIGILGLVGFAPVAQAHDDVNNPGTNDHENRPTAPTPQLGGVCEVIGTVDIGNHEGTGGVTADSKHHNHYRFQGVQIICQNLPVGDDTTPFERTFAVEASGGTDGPQDGSVHGEDALEGWSHKDCYAGGCTFSSPKGTFTDLYDGTNTNDDTDGDGVPDQCTNCGEIEARSINPATQLPNGELDSVSTRNVVMFARDGNLVTAWGALKDPSGTVGSTLPADQNLCFHTELEFTPINVHEHEGGKHAAGEHADQATLVGEALIWIDEVGDKDACGINGHGGKK